MKTIRFNIIKYRLPYFMYRPLGLISDVIPIVFPICFVARKMKSLSMAYIAYDIVDHGDNDSCWDIVYKSIEDIIT